MSFFGAVADGPRLITLPYAGGGTADFQRWSIPVLAACLPGRERRLRERGYRAMAPLVEDLAAELPTDEDYAIYGHSMGSWIAFELIRELRRQGRRLPSKLAVGARHAPQLPTTTPPLGRLPQAEFLAGMTERYGGIPQVLLDDPELLAMFLPALRADVVLLDDYRFIEEEPLGLPIRVFWADDDPTVSREQAEAWGVLTTGAFAVEVVTGGHFFLREAGFSDRIGRWVRRALASSTP